MALSGVAVGCGSDDGSTDETSDVAANTGQGAPGTQTLDDLYKGTYEEPTGDAPDHEPGKNIWVIAAGSSTETAQNASDAMETAGEDLGWDVTVYDGKFDPNRQLTGIQQALSDQADGIVALYIDCPVIKNGLQQAEDANVPVVGIEAIDCGQLDETQDNLFDFVVNYAGGQSFTDWIQSWGGAQAAWVVGQTDGEAKVILTVETDLENTKLAGKGSEAEIAACDGCEIVDRVDFVGAEFGPPLQEKIEQSMIAHPEANAFIAAYDAVLTSGGANALKASGRLDDLAIMGGEGSAPGIDLIRENGGMDACIGVPTAWEGYAAFDALIRIFADEDPSKTSSGLGLQACDADHNLPAEEGVAFEAPIDFVAAYEESWGVG